MIPAADVEVAKLALAKMKAEALAEDAPAQAMIRKYERLIKEAECDLRRGNLG